MASNHEALAILEIFGVAVDIRYDPRTQNGHYVV